MLHFESSQFFFKCKKKYSNVTNGFFLVEKKIKSCEGLPDITWLTLLIQKQPIQPLKQILTKQNFKIISFFNIEITTYWIDLRQLRLTCQIHDPGYEIMITL